MNIQEGQRRIDELIQSEMEYGEIIGANFLAIHKGMVLHQGSYGYADIKKTKKMNQNNIFRLFSLSKPITAVAIMRLFEQGKIDLWDSVSMYLEGFQNQKVLKENDSIFSWQLEEVEREVTLWDLLTMTSGIPYPGPECAAGKRMQKLFDEVIKGREKGIFTDTVTLANEIGRIPLQFQPGRSWMYGASADILGAIIEVVTGKSLDSYLQQEIFKPLEMEDTGFYVSEEKQERFTDFYILDQERNILSYHGNDFGMEGFDTMPVFQSGGAGMVSTIKDYSNFSKMLVNQGIWKEKKILGRKTLELMTKNHLTWEQRKTLDWYSTSGYGYGCLVRVLMENGIAATNASLGEYGWDGWSGTYLSIDPKEELIILYFIQRAGAGMTPVVRKLRAVVYGIL